MQTSVLLTILRPPQQHHSFSSLTQPTLRSRIPSYIRTSCIPQRNNPSSTTGTSTLNRPPLPLPFTPSPSSTQLSVTVFNPPPFSNPPCQSNATFSDNSTSSASNILTWAFPFPIPATPPTSVRSWKPSATNICPSSLVVSPARFQKTLMPWCRLRRTQAWRLRC